MKFNSIKVLMSFFVGILLYCLYKKFFLVEAIDASAKDNECNVNPTCKIGCDPVGDPGGLCPNQTPCPPAGPNCGCCDLSEAQCVQNDIKNLCGTQKGNTSDQCMTCAKDNKFKVATIEGCTDEDFKIACDDKVPIISVDCDLDEYTDNFPKHDTASREQLHSDQTKVTIYNMTNEEVYAYATGGGENSWKNMYKMMEDTNVAYYIDNEHNGAADETHKYGGANFGVFSAVRHANPNNPDCNHALEHKSLFEIATPNSINSQPFFNISFNAGYNYGVMFMAYSNVEGKFVSRTANDVTSAAAYGDKEDPGRKCQVQPCAEANGLNNYTEEGIEALSEYFNGSLGHLDYVNVYFFKKGDPRFIDTMGPCGNKQCPGISCDGHQDYKLNGKNICTSSGKGAGKEEIYCWNSFGVEDLTPAQFEDIRSLGGDICPECVYVRNENFKARPWYNESIISTWTGCPA